MKQHRAAKSKQSGFSLVELMIAVSIFAVVMLLVSGIIVNGLRARKTNALNLTAQTYASSVLEQLKKKWAVDLAYKKPEITVNKEPDGYEPPTITIDCIDVDGSVLASGTACPLRRVNVKVYDVNQVLRAELMTEIGAPKQ